MIAHASHWLTMIVAAAFFSGSIIGIVLVVVTLVRVSFPKVH